MMTVFRRYEGSGPFDPLACKQATSWVFGWHDWHQYFDINNSWGPQEPSTVAFLFEMRSYIPSLTKGQRSLSNETVWMARTGKRVWWEGRRNKGHFCVTAKICDFLWMSGLERDRNKGLFCLPPNDLGKSGKNSLVFIVVVPWPCGLVRLTLHSSIRTEIGRELARRSFAWSGSKILTRPP